MKVFYLKGKYERSIVLPENDEPIIHISPSLSDNQAEWQALVDVMRMISGSEDLRYSGAEINTDHRLLYKQLIHECRIKANTLRPFFYEYNQLHNELSGVTIAIKLCKENKAREYI